MARWWEELAALQRADPDSVDPAVRGWWRGLAGRYGTSLAALEPAERAQVEQARADRETKLARNEVAPPGSAHVAWRPPGRCGPAVGGNASAAEPDVDGNSG